MKPQNYNENKIMTTKLQVQSGFTLIELMVSAIIGIFLIGGVVTNFIGSKETEKMRSTTSEMDANARLAMQILRQHISHAGYPSINKIILDKPFYTFEDGTLTQPTCRNGTTIKVPPWGLRTKDRTNLSDIITISYMADNPCIPGRANCPNVIHQNPEALIFTDCTGGGANRDARTVACSTELKSSGTGRGMPDPREAKIYNSFWVRKIAGEKILYCKGSRGGTQPMVEDIEHMAFLYGVTQADGTTKYLNANRVEESKDWELVNSVQVGLLVRSSQKNILKVDSEKKKYFVLDRKVTVDNDELRRLYRVYTTTINLKNKDQRVIL